MLDSLRPLNQAIWRNFNPTEQRRFLRHLGALWDTHRHRCAPEIMAVKNRLQAEGRLVCHQGYIKGYEPMGRKLRSLTGRVEPRRRKNYGCAMS